MNTQDPKKFKSLASWPDGQETSDKHHTREQAEGVCRLLRQEGYGGDRKMFPVATWVEELED